MYEMYCELPKSWRWFSDQSKYVVLVQEEYVTMLKNCDNTINPHIQAIWA